MDYKPKKGKGYRSLYIPVLDPSLFSYRVVGKIINKVVRVGKKPVDLKLILECLVDSKPYLRDFGLCHGLYAELCSVRGFFSYDVPIYVLWDSLHGDVGGLAPEIYITECGILLVLWSRPYIDILSTASGCRGFTDLLIKSADPRGVGFNELRYLESRDGSEPGRKEWSGTYRRSSRNDSVRVTVREYKKP